MPNNNNNSDHIRGSFVSSRTTVVKEMEKLLPLGDPGVFWGGLEVPTIDSVRHFCDMGTVGSGKTVLIRLLMQSILTRIGSKSDNGSPVDIENFGLLIEFDMSHPIIRATENFLDTYFDEKVKDANKKASDLYWKFNSVPKEEKDALTEMWEIARARAVHEKTAREYYINGTISGFRKFQSVITKNSRRDIDVDGVIKEVNALIRTKSLFEKLKESRDFINLIFLCCEIIKEKSIEYLDEDILLEIKEGNTRKGKNGSIISNKKIVDVYNDFSYRALIYDAKQDSASTIKAINPRCKMVILNPFDARCAAWDMAQDINKPSTALQVATILIPENESASQPFFSNAARQLVAGVLQSFILLRPGQWDFRDLINAMKSRERLSELLSKTPYTKDLPQQFLSNQMTAGNILSEIATHMGPYEHIAAAWSKAAEKISLSEWVNSNSILVLGNDAAHRAAIDAVNKLIFQRLTELILAKPETKTDQTWIFLDEIREAGKLEGLSRLLNMGRSKGACVVLGFQDIEGMQAVYGEKEANEIVGQCNHMALLRLNSPKTAQWAADRVGSSETIDEDISFQRGTSTQKSTAIQEGTTSTEQKGRSKGNTRTPDFLFSPVTVLRPVV